VLVPGIRGNVDGVLGDQLQITPPYIITEEIADEIVDKIEESIIEVQEELKIY